MRLQAAGSGSLVFTRTGEIPFIRKYKRKKIGNTEDIQQKRKPLFQLLMSNEGTQAFGPTSQTDWSEKVRFRN